MFSNPEAVELSFWRKEEILFSGYEEKAKKS